MVLREQLSSRHSASQAHHEPHLPSLNKIKQEKLEVLAEKASSTLAGSFLKLLLGQDSKGENGATTQGGDRSFPLAQGFVKIDPGAGLPATYTVQKSHFLVLLKPQITLHSDLDSESTMLLALEAASFRGFTVVDNECAGDPVNAHVMHRYLRLLAFTACYCC
jgi:hypothetical protein